MFDRRPHGLEPAPRALAPVPETLFALAADMIDTHPFDPAEATGVARIAASDNDNHCALLAAALIAQLGE